MEFWWEVKFAMTGIQNPLMAVLIVLINAILIACNARGEFAQSVDLDGISTKANANLYAAMVYLSIGKSSATMATLGQMMDAQRLAKSSPIGIAKVRKIRLVFAHNLINL